MAEFVYKSEQWVACYHPLRGYFGKSVNPVTGRRPIVFNVSQSFSGVPISLPCGQCIGCRLERSRQWAVRIVHEMKMHTESAFLTLTYRPEDMPPHCSLVLRDLQLFMKRLRKRRSRGLRFFACGEYGEVTRRPHYHVLLLNTCFSDRTFWKWSGEFPLFRSDELSELWTLGDHFIGDVSFRSAAYVARYCVKKVTGESAKEHYGDRLPEFTCMSRKPGIGFPWFEKFHGEAYKADSAVIDGKEVRLPRFYDGKYELVDSERLDALKLVRRRTGIELGRVDNTPERRRVRERVDELKMAQFKRDVP